MKRFFVIVLVALFILVVGIVMARNTIIKNGIEKSVKKVVGQKLLIGNMNIGLLSPELRVKEIQVYNPSGYTDEILAEVPEIYINYALMDIIKGFMHFPEIRLSLKQVNIEKDRNGVLNLDHFNPESKKEEKPATEKKGSTKNEFLVNKLVLNIETVRYRDKTKTPATDKEYKVIFSKTLTDVNSAEQIVDAIRAEIIGRLVAEGVNVALGAMQKAIKTGDFKSLKTESKDTLKNLEKQILGEQNASDTTTSLKGGTVEKKDTTQDTKQQAQKLLGNLFGSKK